MSKNLQGKKVMIVWCGHTQDPELEVLQKQVALAMSAPGKKAKKGRFGPTVVMTWHEAEDPAEKGEVDVMIFSGKPVSSSAKYMASRFPQMVVIDLTEGKPHADDPIVVPGKALTTQAWRNLLALDYSKK